MAELNPTPNNPPGNPAGYSGSTNLGTGRVRGDEPTARDSGPKVSWGAIFSGALLVLGFQFLFTLLGSAIGLSALHFESGQTPDTGAAIAAGVYFIVTMVISFFIGGFATSRLAGLRVGPNAGFHGLTVWALVAVTAATLITSGAGAFLGAGVQMAGQAAQDITIQVVPESNTGNLPPGQLQQQKRQLEHAKQKAKQAAGTARKVAAGGSWFIFATFLFGAIAAFLGASSGVSSFRRKMGSAS
jgi:hypothetical protein